ncbi:hypothetical protein FA95DRAFT_1556808 [Auriscalpium vulgare]|uniref:Uncharacterized protein n=1 Tax=Auriscalpium vulgare TaxID=40419 RepID=A0ACB8RZA0_9AGAM|nr:hypothetical protein FA95DRAFT_1556808 [Auriscalpium vulgare]
MACDVAAHSADVPQHATHHQMFIVFRERISIGEVTRHMHVEEWNRYTKDAWLDMLNPTSTVPSATLMQRESDVVFERLREEIGKLEQRSEDFKRILDELHALVGRVQELNHGALANTITASRSSRLLKKTLGRSGEPMDDDDRDEPSPVDTFEKRLSPLRPQETVAGKKSGALAALRSRFGL